MNKALPLYSCVPAAWRHHQGPRLYALPTLQANLDASWRILLVNFSEFPFKNTYIMSMNHNLHLFWCTSNIFYLFSMQLQLFMYQKFLYFACWEEVANNAKQHGNILCLALYWRLCIVRVSLLCLFLLIFFPLYDLKPIHINIAVRTKIFFEILTIKPMHREWASFSKFWKYQPLGKLFKRNYWFLFFKFNF